MSGLPVFDGFRIERVEESVAPSKKHQRLSVDDPGGRRTPLAMINPWTNLGVVLAHELSGLLVEGDQTRRLRRGDVRVRPVLSVGSANVKHVADDGDGAIGGVVREHSELVHHVVFPKNVAILGADLDLRFARPCPILGFVLKGPLVAVRQPVQVEAQDFAARGDDVKPVALHGGRREQAEIFPIVHFARSELGNDQLPEESAGLFFKDHQHAPVALMLGIAWRIVVGAHEDLSVGHGDVAIALRAQLHHQFDILRRGQVDLLGAALELAGFESLRKPLGGRIHVAARVVSAPLRPIGQHGGGCGGNPGGQRGGAQE